MEWREPQGFKDLIAWQKADRMASLAYGACKDLPPGHRWLADQVLRCSLSIPANIAEGHGRGTKAEILRFVDIARGSLSELEYFIHFMRNESLLAEDKITALDAARIETGRVLFGFWRSLKSLSNRDWDHSGRIAEDAGIYGIS